MPLYVTVKQRKLAPERGFFAHNLLKNSRKTHHKLIKAGKEHPPASCASDSYPGHPTGL